MKRTITISLRVYLIMLVEMVLASGVILTLVVHRDVPTTIVRP